MTNKPRVEPSVFNGYPCTACGAKGPANDPMLPYGAHMCRIDRVEPSVSEPANICKCGHSDEFHDDGRLCCCFRKSANLMCLCNQFEPVIAPQPTPPTYSIASELDADEYDAEYRAMRNAPPCECGREKNHPCHLSQESATDHAYQPRRTESEVAPQPPPEPDISELKPIQAYVRGLDDAREQCGCQGAAPQGVGKLFDLLARCAPDIQHELADGEVGTPWQCKLDCRKCLLEAALGWRNSKSEGVGKLSPEPEMCFCQRSKEECRSLGGHARAIDSYKPEVAAESVSAQLDREFGQRVEHAAECRCDRCKREAKGVEGVGPRELANEIVRCAAELVAELPDRASPEDWPEALIVTDAELREIAMDVIATYLESHTLTFRAELQQAHDAIATWRSGYELQFLRAKDAEIENAELRSRL